MLKCLWCKPFSCKSKFIWEFQPWVLFSNYLHLLKLLWGLKIKPIMDEWSGMKRNRFSILHCRVCIGVMEQTKCKYGDKSYCVPLCLILLNTSPALNTVEWPNHTIAAHKRRQWVRTIDLTRIQTGNSASSSNFHHWWPLLALLVELVLRY